MATQPRTTAKGSSAARGAKSPARGKNDQAPRQSSQLASEEDDRDASW